MADHKITDDQQKKLDAAKQQLAANKDAREKSLEAAAGSKPTPTQEENDITRLGGYIPEHEPDGSPVQTSFPEQHQQQHTKQMDARRSGGQYATRASTPIKPSET